jgi:PAS domain S-box-containing protein
VFLLVGGYLFYHFQEQQMRRRIEDGLSIVAQLKANQIEQWRAERLTDANILMASPFLIDGVAKYMASPADTGLRNEIIASLASIEKSYPYQDVLLVDLNGSVVLDLNESVNLLGDVTLAQLAVAVKEHKAVVTDFHYPPDRNSPQLDVVAPLFPWGVDSQPAIGAVVLCIEPSQYLSPLVQSSPIPSETAESFLVKRDGDQVLFLNELRHQKDTALKLRIPLSQQEAPAVMAVLGKEGVVQGKDYRGVEVLAALKHVPDSPWYVVTKIDTSEALSAWLFQARIIVVFVAGLVAFALAATGLIWQRRQRLAYQELYQAEVESQALRRHFEYLVKYANDIIILADEDHHIVEANDRALESYGYTREEMLGLPLAALIPPGGFSSYRERLRKLKKEGAILVETIHQCKNGSILPVEISARSIKIEDKPYIQTIVRNITERKRVEHEKSTILAAMSELVIYQDLEHRVLFANRAASESVGLAPEDLVGRYCYEVWHQRSLPCVNCPVAKAWETGEFHENEMSSPDGRFWLVRGYSVKDHDGVVSGAIEVTQDITERKRAEGALAEEATRRRILMDQSRDGISILDEDSKLLEANRRFAEMLGYTPEELKDFHTWDWDTQWTREELLEMGRDVDEAGVHLETCHRRKDGTVFDVEISVNSAVVAGKKLLFCVSRDITERRKAEEVLHLSEQNFRDSIENSPLGIRIASKDGKTLYANQALLNMWGYSSIEELEAVPRKQRYTPGSYDEHRTRLEKRKREEHISSSYEISIVCKDGQVRHLSASRGELLWDGEKQFQVVYQDITDRKQVEQALRESEERYRFLVELSPEAIFVASEGKHVFANSAGLKLLGASSPDQIIGKPVADFIHPDYREIVAERMRKAMETGIVPPVMEEKFIRLDGAEIDVEVRAAPLVYQGKIAMQVFISDITERKRAEEALRESEAKHRTLFETMAQGVVYQNAKGQIISANTAAERILGLTLDQMMGRTSIDPRWKAIHEDGSDFPGDTHPSMLALKMSKPVRNVVMGVFHPGFNKRVWININAIPQFVAGESKPYQVYTTFEDITERKLAAEELEKAVEELQRSNAELERFAYVASHDLQEPLRMVSSYTQLLERRYKDKLDADANDFIDYAVGGAKRMEELLTDLLVYSRVGTRAKPFKGTDMEAVLEATLDNLQVAIKEGKAGVTHDPLPTVMADEGQLVQVFQNLIGNAVKFHGEKPPRIHVSAEQRDSEWVFSVKDNGIGIEPQYFDRVFLIFQRLHRDEYPGTGAGLAIVKKIIERHGGRVWIESQPGKGSTFYFSIKATDGRQEARAAIDERRVKGGKR